jgi:hypothetical protein
MRRVSARPCTSSMIGATIPDDFAFMRKSYHAGPD